MSDMLSISSTAVMAYQRALGTVSNNIANVGTEGYSRQDITLSANTPSKQGTVYIGNGVLFDGVKRQVDDFIESNLRNSKSELAAQEPMLSYANRVIDIMGSESTGLTTAINQFFEGAQALSADPSSTILRAGFSSDSSSLTLRFRELSGQLQSLQTETGQALDSKVGQVNTLANQLALVNKQLAKNITEAKQPPELLDQRDRILKNLSQFVSIQTSFTVNGTVNVSLGQTMTQGLLVDNQQVKPLVATYGNTAAANVTMGLRALDGGIDTLSGISRGEVGGLLSFREQVLTPARSALDTLATTFSSAVNAIHSESLDGYGSPGTALFGFDAAPAGSYVAGGMRVLLDDPQKIAAAAQFRVIDNPNNPSNLSASLSYSTPTPSTVPADIAAVLKNNPSVSAGTAVTVSSSQPFSMLTGVAQGTADATIYLDDLQADQAVQVMTREGVHVLGTALSLDEQAMVLRDTYGFNNAAAYNTSYLNQTGDEAYRISDLFLGAKAQPSLSQVFDDAGGAMDGTPTAALLQGGRIAASLTAIAADAITLNGRSLGALTPAGTNLQATEIAAWLNTANAKQEKITFTASTTAGNLTVDGVTVALAGTETAAQVAAAVAGLTYTSDRVAVDNGDGSVTFQWAVADADDYSVVVDTAATGVTAQTEITAAYIATAAGLTATASNEIRVPGTSLNLSRTVSLQGEGGTAVTISPSGSFASASDLVTSINAQSATTRVVASLSRDGELVLTNAAGFEGNHITVGPADLGGVSDNALGLTLGDSTTTYAGSIALTRSLDDPIDQEVRVGMGTTGAATDLQALGLRAAVYIDGSASDDYVVMVSGQGSFTASASYTASVLDAKQSLRAEPFDVAFTADNAYTITDRATGSVVASRAFNGTAFPSTMEYRGVTLTFTSPPAMGDKFGVDGNNDGLGNNEGMLRMVGLASSKDMPGGKTFSEAYIEQVSAVGNMSQQALVSKDALTVVYDQAVEARDGISGVSLDEEAANLIRFQQAYQASAKVMQTASTLFDAILALR